MSNFLFKEEKKISFLYIKSYDRYINKPNTSINEAHLINVIQPNIKQEIKWIKNLKSHHSFKKDSDLFNYIHKKIEVKKLNSFRLKIINDINKSKNIRELYYKISN